MSEPTTEYRIVKPKPRSKKLSPRIDLAAMVSVSFLLIMFFMVNQAMSRPQVMDLGLPDASGTSCGGCCGRPDFRRTITILLDDDNKVICYRGLLEVPEYGGNPKKLGFGKNGIRKELILAKNRIPKITGDENRGAIVIIKPSKKCNYKNLVDILDEMAIAEIPTYAIVNDFTPEEQILLASK